MNGVAAPFSERERMRKISQRGILKRNGWKVLGQESVQGKRGEKDTSSAAQTGSNAHLRMGHSRKKMRRRADRPLESLGAFALDVQINWRERRCKGGILSS